MFLVSEYIFLLLYTTSHSNGITKTTHLGNSLSTVNLYRVHFESIYCICLVYCYFFLFEALFSYKVQSIESSVGGHDHKKKKIISVMTKHTLEIFIA